MWKWNDLKRFLKKEAEPDYSGYAAIMWPAKYPYQGNARYQPENPHCTIITLTSDINSVNYTKEDILSVIRATDWNVLLPATVKGLEWFGPDQNIPVLTLEHDYLEKYHNQIKIALDNVNAVYDTTYPEYKPHVTITPDAALEGVYPSKIFLAPVELWWGDEHIKVNS